MWDAASEASVSALQYYERARSIFWCTPTLPYRRIDERLTETFVTFDSVFDLSLPIAAYLYRSACNENLLLVKLIQSIHSLWNVHVMAETTTQSSLQDYSVSSPHHAHLSSQPAATPQIGNNYYSDCPCPEQKNRECLSDDQWSGSNTRPQSSVPVGAEGMEDGSTSEVMGFVETEEESDDASLAEQTASTRRRRMAVACAGMIITATVIGTLLLFLLTEPIEYLVRISPEVRTELEST